MNNYKCENAQIFKNGLLVGIKCKATNDYCYFCRYCATKKMPEHTENAKYCKHNPNKIEQI
jgi:hypothetical protein